MTIEVDSKVETIVEEVLSPEKFSLVKHIKNGGVTLPTQDLTIITDSEKAYWIINLRNKKNDIIIKQNDIPIENMGIAGPQSTDPDLFKELEKAADELQKEINELLVELYESRITVSLEAVSPAIHKAVSAKGKAQRKSIKEANPEFTGVDVENAISDWVMNELARLSIRKIVQESTGATQTEVMTHSEIAEVMDGLPRAESLRLMNTVSDLLTSSAVADVKADAGFRGRNTDVASEPLHNDGAEDSA